MVIDHALGVAGRARGVAERRSRPIRRPGRPRRRQGRPPPAAPRSRAGPGARPRRRRIDDIDDPPVAPHCASAALTTGAPRVSVEQHLGLTMLEDERDRRRVEARVEALSTAPAIGTPKCASSIGGVLGTAPRPCRRAGRPGRAGAERACDNAGRPPPSCSDWLAVDHTGRSGNTEALQARKSSGVTGDGSRRVRGSPWSKMLVSPAHPPSPPLLAARFYRLGAGSARGRRLGRRCPCRWRTAAAARQRIRNSTVAW